MDQRVKGGGTRPLTKDIDNLVGTSGDDTFNGIVGGDNATFTAFDSVNGAGGVNTLNLLAGAVDVGALPDATTIKNIQTVNLVNGATNKFTGEVNATAFGADLKNLWQVGGANAVVGLANGQTAGFRGAEAAIADLTFTGETGGIALDKVGTGANAAYTVNAGSENLTTLNISGSVATVPATPKVPGKLQINLAVADEDEDDSTVETVNLAMTSAVDFSFGTGNGVAAITDFNAGASTGAITLAAESLDALVALETLVTGSGADKVTLDLSKFEAKEVTVDLGAGNDVITLDGATLPKATTSITLGAGSDTVKLGSLNNVGTSDAELKKSLVTITDFKTADRDVIALEGGMSTNQDAIQNAVDAAVATTDTLFNAYTVAEAAALDTGFQFIYDEVLYVGTDKALIQLAGISKELGLNSFDDISS